MTFSLHDKRIVIDDKSKFVRSEKMNVLLNGNIGYYPHDHQAQPYRFICMYAAVSPLIRSNQAPSRFYRLIRFISRQNCNLLQRRLRIDLFLKRP